jgi:uncharacterized protein
MPISMYKASAPIFVQFLNGLSGVLDKAAAAPNVDQAALLDKKLAPDMFPFVRQVRAATDHAVTACSRLAGVEPPNLGGDETTIPQLKERINKAVTFIKGLKPAQIDGTEDKEITLKFGQNERKFTGQNLLLNFCLPNFYFHTTTAYDIVRNAGVEIGKRDFMSQPVQM